MVYIKWFKDLSKESLKEAGGKGANLAEMANLNLPVPPGFVVLAATYREFIERTGIKERIFKLLHNLDIEETEKLQEIAKQIQALIIGTEVPEEIKEAIIENYESLGVVQGKTEELLKNQEVFVAVRSSATAEDLPTASFAGQQATFLNVKGKEQLIRAIRACWASLFTARAIYYREKNKFPHEKVLIAVVVQKMINSEKSGIMFTINPSTNNPQEIIIEAIYGLGELIVSGQVNPDLYLLDKEEGNIKKIEVRRKEWGLFRNEKGENEKKKIKEDLREKQVLNEKEIKELARLGKKIEKHYGYPQDIEWALEKDTLFIVQSRAVTTYQPKEERTLEKGEKEKKRRIILKGETASRGSYSGPVKIIKTVSELNKIEKGDILVTRMTNPDMVPAMQKAGAILTDEGGMTCHAAIVSREVGIPCLVGTEHATEILKDGEIITVDASQGVVYEGEVKTKKEIKKEPAFSSSESPLTATEIKVILDLPEKAEEVAQRYNPDGVGLVRLEFIIAQGGVHPAQYVRENNLEDYLVLLKKGLRKIASAFRNKPVWVRSSDIRTDEYRHLKGGEKEPQESNPMLGWHGIRRLLDEPLILKTELKAIKELHQEGLTNLGIMFPFVINQEEIKKAKELLREQGFDLEKLDWGVMIETPAACWIIENLCREGIKFVSFGTNDLTQLTLGLDRNNERIQKLFEETHPAVLGEIAKVIRVCKKYHVKTSICGQAGSKPLMAEFLVHQGIDSLSTNVDALEEIRRVVARTERKILLAKEIKK